MNMDTYYEKIKLLLDKPYYINLVSMGITEDHYNPIFSIIFKQKIKIKKTKSYFHLLDEYNNIIYYEYPDGDWVKKEYKEGRLFYFENSDGYILKKE